MRNAIELKLNRYVKELALRDCLFVIASFDFSQPLISGFGKSIEEAFAVASSQPLPPNSVVCQRVISSEILWRDKYGREVRPEHFENEVPSLEYR